VIFLSVIAAADEFACQVADILSTFPTKTQPGPKEAAEKEWKSVILHENRLKSQMMAFAMWLVFLIKGG